MDQFLDEITETQRREVKSLRSHSRWAVRVRGPARVLN